MSTKVRDYDSTVARMAGNIAAGIAGSSYSASVESAEEMAIVSVAVARAIVAETKRTEPVVESK